MTKGVKFLRLKIPCKHRKLDFVWQITGNMAELTWQFDDGAIYYVVLEINTTKVPQEAQQQTLFSCSSFSKAVC